MSHFDDIVREWSPVLARLAGLLIVGRPDTQVGSADDLRAALQIPAQTPLRLQVVEMPLIEISSRDLRRRAAQRRSLRYLVPRAVEAYIQDKHLYGAS